MYNIILGTGILDRYRLDDNSETIYKRTKLLLFMEIQIKITCIDIGSAVFVYFDTILGT